MTNRPGRRARFALSLVLCYWIALFVATHVPSPDVADVVTGQDKLAHLLAFAILGVLLARFVATRRPLTPVVIVVLIGVAATYGALDELTQSLIPGRDANHVDWIADLLGAALGVIVFAWFFAPPPHAPRSERPADS